MPAKKFPFYLKATLIIIGLYFLIDMLYIGQLIILPLVFSVIIAILLSPLVDLLVRIHFNRVLAIFISISLLITIATGSVLLLSMQMGRFTESFPLLLDKSQDALSSSIRWISSTFNIKISSVNTFIEETKAEIIISSKSYLGQTLTMVGSGLVVIFLIPVYIFMILYYQPLLLDFIRKVFGRSNKTEVNEVLSSTKSIIQRYLVALFIETIIVAVLNSVGLMLIGIDYAILFGVIGALLNLIPYIGGIIAIALPMMLALATQSVTSALLVLLAYSIIQLIDNNYIIPKLVGSRVKINALVSIVVVIAGGALWGIPGMFLSIPLTAIVKVIFDHIDSLKPWGFLLGDSMPPLTSFKLPILRKIIKPAIIKSEGGKP